MPLIYTLNLFRNGSEVEEAWNGITFDFNELIDSIRIRFNRSTYQDYFGPFNVSASTSFDAKNADADEASHRISYLDLFDISPLNTLNHGKCYTISFKNTTYFYAMDNLLLGFKTQLLLFLHGLGQNLGIITHFYAVRPDIYVLKPGYNYRADFEGKIYIAFVFQFFKSLVTLFKMLLFKSWINVLTSIVMRT